jgi:predicted phage baseplate assembly protein
VPDFVGAGPQDRSFVTATDQDGTTRVIFGDGVRGARPPTGSENVLARYRSGQGRSGNVAAGRITIATSRPLGVAEVTNPVPATGGADPEDRDVVRRNAALGVQALDRLVSVSDYADFAAAFAGIGSAVAAELTDGRRRLVHVTIAGIDDEPISPTSDLLRNLRQALLDLGDPHLDVRVAPRALKLAVISANVAIAADRRWADVEPALRTAVLSRFGPASRLVGRSLASSAVLAAMAGAPGVDYVDLEILDALDEVGLVSADPSAGLQLRSGLAARLAETDPGVPGGIRPAELVLVSPLAPDTLVLAEL